VELEQRYVVTFFSDEGMPGVQIVERFRRHYGEDAFSRTQVYFWIDEVKRGRTDLNTTAGPGREPDESLAAVIAGKLDADFYFSARKLAQSLGIAASMVCRDLTQGLGMKCRHVRWVPHTLTPAQKLMRAELAQIMLQALAKHQHGNYHFPFPIPEICQRCARCQYTGNIVLLMDSCTAHMFPSFESLCTQHGITICLLPPHSSN
jgi:hypothetical protein